MAQKLYHAPESPGRLVKTEIAGDFPSGPVVKTLHFHCLIPGQGTKILHGAGCTAPRPPQKNPKKQKTEISGHRSQSF